MHFFKVQLILKSKNKPKIFVRYSYEVVIHKNRGQLNFLSSTLSLINLTLFIDKNPVPDTDTRCINFLNKTPEDKEYFLN